MSLRIFSFGGGRQSMSVMVLAARGKVQYDVFCFANVGHDSENPDTIDYVRNVVTPYAMQHGLAFIELKKYRRTGQVETLWEYIHRTERSVPIPARMANGAPGNRSCTFKFKIEVINRWLRMHGATRENQAIVGLGISFDEIQRMRTSTMPEQINEYPLIDLRFRVEHCEAILREEGLPIPPKSACFFCPFHSRHQWWALKYYRPELFERAVYLEKFIQAKRRNLDKDPLFFHSSMRPLSEAVPDQLPLWDDDSDMCESGFCQT